MEVRSISTNILVSLSSLPQDVNLIFGQNDESFTVQDGEIGCPD